MREGLEVFLFYDLSLVILFLAESSLERRYGQKRDPKV